jgi:DNA (cytosine-5)-methyltransferase 1
MINIATVFSGIGAFEQALEKLNIKYTIVFASDNGEREISKESNEKLLKIFNSVKYKSNIQDIVKAEYVKTKKENFVKNSYFSNYSINEDKWHEDIRFIDGRKYKNKVDIFVGGSPCQSFSIIGKKAGLNDARGTLFYDYARLVNEIKPKVFIFENVQGMLIHDKGNTWKIIKEIFDSLGYKLYYEVLNSIDYNIPQFRKRLFVVGFRDKNINFKFPKKQMLNMKASDLIEKQVDQKYFLGEKGFKFVTNLKYKNRAKIIGEYIRAQKANQQFNWNGDFVFIDEKNIKFNDNFKKPYLSNYQGQKGYIRKLTPKELLRFMGFKDNFKIVNPDMQMYRQIGNSIVVNVLESIIIEIMRALNYEKT